MLILTCSRFCFIDTNMFFLSEVDTGLWYIVIDSVCEDAHVLNAALSTHLFQNRLVAAC